MDRGTIRQLEARGVRDGWRCLEVDAGGGSIATWLWERGGPGRRIVAPALDTRFLDALGRPKRETGGLPRIRGCWSPPRIGL